MLKKILFGLVLFLPGIAHADRLGSLKNGADVLLTTQPAAGRIISSTGSVSSLVSNDYTNVCTISLPAGTWSISGIIYGTAPNTGSVIRMAISLNSGTDTSDHLSGDNENANDYNTGQSVGISVPGWPLTVAVTTTVYLKARITHSNNSGTITGRLTALRQ